MIERDMEELGRAIAAVQDERIAPHALPPLVRRPRRRVASWVLVAAGFAAGVALTCVAFAIRLDHGVRDLFLPSTTGVVVITTLGANGANVAFDDRPVTRAGPSVTVDLVSMGLHTVLVDEPGYITQTLTLVMTEQTPLLPVKVQMKPVLPPAPPKHWQFHDDGDGDGDRDDGEDANAGPKCAFASPLPAGTKVFATGAYRGRDVDFELGDSGNDAGQFDVVVNDTKEPVLLVLGAYDPTLWNISWTPGTRIAAVFVSGYEKQVVAGLPNDIPLTISTYDNGAGCGDFYVSADERAHVKAGVRSALGLNVDQFVVPDAKGHVVIGDRISDDAKLVTDPAHSPASIRASSRPAGTAALEGAVRMGLLRKATADDARRWAKVSGKKEPRLDSAFVVLSKFWFPAGLYGGHAATFFVKKGVEAPRGNPGHSKVYDFNTALCTEGTMPCSDDDE